MWSLEAQIYKASLNLTVCKILPVCNVLVMAALHRISRLFAVPLDEAGVSGPS